MTSRRPLLPVVLPAVALLAALLSAPPAHAVTEPAGFAAQTAPTPAAPALPRGDVRPRGRAMAWSMTHSTVRVADHERRRVDAVDISGRITAKVRERHLRTLIRRGAVVTVSQARSWAAQSAFRRIIAVPFVSCVRARSRTAIVRCSAKGGSTLRVAVAKDGRARVRATLARQQLRHARLTDRPLMAQVATADALWAGAPRSCALDHMRTQTTAECSGRNIAPLPMTWPKGPVSRKLLGASLGRSGSAPLLGSGGDGCGSAYSKTSSGLSIASGFVSMIPVAGSVLGPATSAASSYYGNMGDQAGDACLTAEFELINQQLADQQAEIVGLQDDFELSQNQFYQGELSSAADTTTVAAGIYLEALQNISPTEGALGLFGQFMEQSGFWTLGMQPEAGASVEGSASNPLTFQAAMGIATDASSFVLNLNDLAGSFVNVEACPNGQCAAAVTSSPTSALLSMWNQKAVTLLKAWQANQDAGGPSGTNVVGLYDEYNDSIIADYAQSLNSLQQAYQMEYLVNQLNYYHGTEVCSETTSPCEQIESLGSVPGTYYDFNDTGSSATPGQQAAAYNSAQRGLTATYGARVNTLYINVLNYLASDVPRLPQAYPTTSVSIKVKGRTIVDPNPIDYAAQVGAALTAIPFGPAATPLAQLPAATRGNWNAQAVLYQFGGLKDVNACAETLWTFNKTEGISGTPQQALSAPGACPSIFTLDGGPLNQGYYDGDRLQPYTNYTGRTLSTTPAISLTGPMQVNLRLCNPQSPDLTWYTPSASATGNAAGLVSGTWYLACGNWAAVAPDSCFRGAHCPVEWSDVAAAPFSFVASQYYQTDGAYPSLPPGEDPTPSSVNVNEITYDNQNWQAAVNYTDGYARGVGACYAGGQTACDGGDDIAYFSSVTSDSSSWKYVNWGLAVANLASKGGSGFMIPVQMAYYRQSSPMTMAFQPRQDAQMAVDGFVCDGATCTVADGGRWTFSLAPAGVQSWQYGYTILTVRPAS